MSNTNKTVTLFIQCLVDGIYPEVGEAVVRIFGKLGINLICPTNQTCCGQPAFNAGYRREAVVAAKRFIDIFETAEVIVCPSGSCVTMVRHHYPQLFDDDGPWLQRARQVAAKTYELTEYLVDVLGVEDLGAHYDGTITYHDSCHLLRNLRVKAQPRKLLSKVSGAEFIEMHDADRCCGFGGSFSVKYADISSAMVADKVNNIIASGADTVVGCDMGCLMNIQGMLSRKRSTIKTMHIAQILAGTTIEELCE
jgi:L-lactate dehydrogenase complex protein LldE